MRSVVALLLLITAACAPGNEDARDPNIITVAIRNGPNNLNPLVANDEFSARVAQLVFSSLVDLGDDLRPRPVLARHIDNPDPLTYIVHLRRGVRFHDGRELTARDVVYTYGLLLDPAFVSPYKGAYRMLASVRALDDYTVEFRLKEPFAAFVGQLATPPVIPTGSVETLSEFPIGTGPYRFVRYDVDDQVVLSAFEGYYDGLPNNAGIILKVIPDDTMRGLELRKGSIDLVINYMPPDIVHQLEQVDKEFQIKRTPGLDLSYLAFNMRDPVLRDRRVRHAIAYAIDREAIVKYLRRDLARVAAGILPPQVWAAEPDVHQFRYNPERARRLLDEAGYPDPDGDGPLPRLRLSLKVSTTEEVVLQATVIQGDLRRVGIDLDVRTYEFATFFADVIKGNFQMYSLQWVGGALADPDILNRLFHSRQVPPSGFNRGFYSNPDVDRLLELAGAARTEPERKRYYSEVQKLIAWDAPYVPLWHRMNVIIARHDLTGLHLDPIGSYESLKDVRRVGAPASAAAPNP